MTYKRILNILYKKGVAVMKYINSQRCQLKMTVGTLYRVALVPTGE
jgi:hypothetical protein